MPVKMDVGLHAIRKEESATGVDLKAGAVGKVGLKMVAMVQLVEVDIDAC